MSFNLLEKFFLGKKDLKMSLDNWTFLIIHINKVEIVVDSTYFDSIIAIFLALLLNLFNGQ